MEVIRKIDLHCGQTYLTITDDGYYLECGDVFMEREKDYGTRPYRFIDFHNPADINKRVMTICTMVGCPMSCCFCASRKSFKRILSAKEIVNQVEFLINNGALCGRNKDPNNSQEFRILYTRMGEPMLNVSAVGDSIRYFIDQYPQVIIGMSTCGIKPGLEEFIKLSGILMHVDIQISLHSTEDSERSFLFGVETGKNIMSIPEIADFSTKWFERTGKKLSLNIVLFDNYTYNIPALMSYFNPRYVWFRLSPWNEVPGVPMKSLLKTEDVIAKRPLSSEYLRTIIKSIEEAGVAYAYAPAIDEEIRYNVACGQALLAFNGTLKSGG